MGALVEVLTEDGRKSTIRLFEVPQRGDVIECPDGSRVVVSEIEPVRPGNAVDAEIIVKTA
jgi:hypothetical protein